MTETHDNQTRQRLLEIFSMVNMNTLPAMSEHVTELIALLASNRTNAQEVADTILKDYSLTNRILQVVNSAYYSRGTPVSTISRAITVIGFDTLRQLAATTALFEEFIRTGTEKDEIAGAFTMSLISATQSKIYCEMKKTRFSSEEAYVCTLLHNLGKFVVLIYLPAQYQAVEQHIQKGYSEEHSNRIALKGLTYSQIGREIATFWNFSKRIVDCMATEPPRPEKNQDPFLFLQNLVVFNNKLTSNFFNGTRVELADLIYKFGGILEIGEADALSLVDKSISACENYSKTMRDGLEKIKKGRSSQITVTKDPSGHWVRLS
ncbi:MAG: HDOD domain-containing protein [Desulfobulbaceae bacterium]|nr:HDOD domain-containing protein [Desulfobulbaceae bacterium]HIJ91440.1 HDOD domain-containing protein [Deltaproteobacteria bacterium]